MPDKATYWKRRNAGLCASCAGSLDEREGMAECQSCVDWRNFRRREARHARERQSLLDNAPRIPGPSRTFVDIDDGLVHLSFANKPPARNLTELLEQESVIGEYRGARSKGYAGNLTEQLELERRLGVSPGGMYDE